MGCTLRPGRPADRSCGDAAGRLFRWLRGREPQRGAGRGEGSLALPAGVGLPMQAGEVLLIQSHYLNATASDINAQASLSIDYVTEDPGVHAGAFFFYDPF